MVSPLTVVMYLVACVGLVFMPVNEGGYDRYHLPKELWLAGGALAAVAVTWRRCVPLDAAAGVLFALLAAAGVSGLLATTPVLAERGVALIACGAALFFAARTCGEGEAAAVRAAIVIAGAGIAIVALLESLGVVSGLSGAGRAPGATIGQRNAVAHTLLIASPAAWTMASRSSLRGERVLGVIGAALLAAGIVVTRTRAAWLMAPLALGVWAWLSADRRRAIVPVAVAAVVALAIPTALQWSSQTPYRDTLARLLDASSGSGAGRLVQYRASLELAAAHPVLGVGPGNWMVQYPTVSPPGDPTFRAEGWLHTGRLASSDWIATITEGGVVAAALALVFVLSCLRAARRNGETCAVLLAAAGVGALDSVLQLPAAAAFAAVLLGLGLPASAEARPMPHALRAVLAALLAVAVVLGARRVLALQERSWPEPKTFAGSEAALRWNPDDLQARFQLAQSYVDAKDCEKARPHIEVLRRLLPHHAQPRQMEAACRPTE